MFEKFLVNFALPKKYIFITFGFIFILLSVIIFLFLSTLAARQEVLAWEVEVARNLQNFSSISPLMVFISFFGETNVTIVLFIGAIGFLYLKGYRKEAAFMPAVLLSPILNAILKEAVARPRPTQALINVFEPSPQYSFPSGHVMTYVVFFGFLAFLSISLPRLEPRWRAVLLVICLPLLFLIGVSRIYLGVHWPSDVIGAYLFGGLYLLVLISIYLKYIYRLPDMGDK